MLSTIHAKNYRFRVSARIMVALMIVFTSSCASLLQMDMERIPSLKPMAWLQYGRDVLEVEFLGDGRILAVIAQPEGPDGTKLEVLDYNFNVLGDDGFPFELRKVTHIFRRPGGHSWYFVYRLDNRSRLAYLDASGEGRDIHIYDLGDLSLLFESRFVYTSHGYRPQLFFAPLYSNTIFVKEGAFPAKVAVTQPNLVVFDLVYNFETNELFATNLVDRRLIRFIEDKSGFRKKGHIDLSVTPLGISIDESTGNLWVLDYSTNQLEVVSSKGVLSSISEHAMLPNKSFEGDWKKFDPEPPNNFVPNRATAFHLDSKGVLIAISDGKLIIQNTRKFGALPPFRLEGTESVGKLAVSQDQRYLLLLSNRRDLLLYDLSDL